MNLLRPITKPFAVAVLAAGVLGAAQPASAAPVQLYSATTTGLQDMTHQNAYTWQLNGVNTQVGMGPRFRRQAWIVSADDDADIGLEGANERDHAARGGALKRHHRQADEIRPVLIDQLLDGAAHRRLGEDEIGDGNVVVRIEVAGKRDERTIRDPNRDGRRVLE